MRKQILLSMIFFVFLLSILSVSAASSGTAHATDSSLSLSVTLVSGWNFISPPYADTPISVDASNCGSDAVAVASAIPAIYHYAPSTGNYNTIPSISQMKPGLGYWVYLDSETSGIKECVIKFTGTKKVTTSTLGDKFDGSLVAGWNQLGSTTDTTQITSNENKGTCDIGIIYGYNSKTGEYTATETLSAGNSYWVYVESNCQLQVSSISLPVPSSTPIITLTPAVTTSPTSTSSPITTSSPSPTSQGCIVTGCSSGFVCNPVSNSCQDETKFLNGQLPNYGYIEHVDGALNNADMSWNVFLLHLNDQESVLAKENSGIELPTFIRHGCTEIWGAVFGLGCHFGPDEVGPVYMGPSTYHNFDRTNSFTLEAWIRSASVTNEQILLLKGDITRGYSLRLSPEGKLSMALTNSKTFETKVVGATILTDGKWHHVMAVYSGTSTAAGIKLYVDGRAEQTTVASDSLGSNTIQKSDGYIYVGQKYSGDMDEFALYARALTANEAFGHFMRNSKKGIPVKYDTSPVSSGGGFEPAYQFGCVENGRLMFPRTCSGTTANYCASASNGYVLVEDCKTCNKCASGTTCSAAGKCVSSASGSGGSTGTVINLDCVDGTFLGSCSTNKPKRCIGGQLINDCVGCGCPAAKPVCDNFNTGLCLAAS